MNKRCPVEEGQGQFLQRKKTKVKNHSFLTSTDLSLLPPAIRAKIEREREEERKSKIVNPADVEVKQTMKEKIENMIQEKNLDQQSIPQEILWNEYNYGIFDEFLESFGKDSEADINQYLYCWLCPN